MGEWTNRLSTALIATVVTLLIWTWAAEKTREDRTITGTIRFVAGAEQALTVDPASPISVTLQVRGSRDAIERAAALLDKSGADLRLGLGDVPNTPGPHRIKIKNAFAQLDPIERSDLTVISAQPEEVTLSIGRLVTVKVPIEAEIPLAQISGSVSIDPSEASVTLPESIAESMMQTKVEAYVDVKNLDTTGRNTVTVPLRLPEKFSAARSVARIEPATATVSFILVSRDRTAVIPTVPIQIAGPPADLRNYDVQVEPGSDFLRSVTISGPSDAISQLESGRTRIAAVVHLGADDLARKSVTKPVSMWLLPPGVTVTRIGSSNDIAPLIPLRITERPRIPPVPSNEPTGTPRS